jgi:hypothetical protein
MAERVSWIVDYMLLGIPFHKRFPNFPKKCLYCKVPINEWINVNFEECDNNHSSDEANDEHIEGVNNDVVEDKDDGNNEKEFAYKFSA